MARPPIKGPRGGAPTDQASGTPDTASPPVHPWWIGLASRLLSWLLVLLRATWRVRFGTGSEHLDRLLATERPIIFAFWHNRLVVCDILRNRTIDRGRPVVLLTSLSRDGELAARAAGFRGYRIIRGSTSRGGLASLLRLRRAMRAGASAALAPDGPRGPACEVQPGTLVLAQRADAPIMPLAYAANRYWRVRSWDRLVVPKPFARLVVSIGEPVELTVDLSDDDLRAASADLQRQLNELVSRAEELVSAS